MEEKIIQRAEYLEATQLSGIEVPEIGINEETNMITISRYNADCGCSFHMEDFCDVVDVNVEKLRKLISKAYMFCTI